MRKAPWPWRWGWRAWAGVTRGGRQCPVASGCCVLRAGAAGAPGAGGAPLAAGNAVEGAFQLEASPLPSCFCVSQQPSRHRTLGTWPPPSAMPRYRICAPPCPSESMLSRTALSHSHRRARCPCGSPATHHASSRINKHPQLRRPDITENKCSNRSCDTYHAYVVKSKAPIQAPGRSCRGTSCGPREGDAEAKAKPEFRAGARLAATTGTSFPAGP